MAYKQPLNYLYRGMHLNRGRNGVMLLNVISYHSLEQSHEESFPAEWYDKAFHKMIKLSDALKDIDSIDGRLLKVKDGSIVLDDLVERKMQAFKTLARTVIGSPLVQQRLKEAFVGFYVDTKSKPHICFRNVSEREPLVVNSLTKISDFLKICAQKRKLVRLTICPQVTQYSILIGALEEILSGLQYELNYFNNQCPTHATEMGQQIVSVCLKFLHEASFSNDPDSCSWMHLAPRACVDSFASRKWEDALEMFNDLIKCLRCEEDLHLHVRKLEVMKEGLSQIKGVVIDQHAGYKDARYQECLVQKKLTRSLGHSSPCLFTLLLYFLYGCVRDIEVDFSGGIWGQGDVNEFCLYMGRILTSDDERIIWSGVKHLDKVLGLFKFVWETAGMKGGLQLQGHLWCAGAANKTLMYKGNVYVLHGMAL